jgi:hypothetical protein
MGVAWISPIQRGVGVLRIQNARLDTTSYVQAVSEVPLGAGVPGMVAGVIIDHHCQAARVDVVGYVAPTMLE